MATYTRLDATELGDIQDGSLAARSRLATLSDTSSARAVIRAIDDYLVAACIGSTGAQDEELEDIAFELGCLWGTQLAHSLNWQWTRVQFDAKAPQAVGIASPDASLVIYPFQTIFFYLEQLLPVRVARSYDVLCEPGRVPMLPPGGLENVMDHVE